MGSIRSLSDSSSGGAKGVEFMKCVDPKFTNFGASIPMAVQVHPIVQIDFGAETVGQFSTQYFAENGCRIPVIGQISINRSVKNFGIFC